MTKKEQLKIIQDSIDFTNNMNKKEFIHFVKSKGHTINYTIDSVIDFIKKYLSNELINAKFIINEDNFEITNIEEINMVKINLLYQKYKKIQIFKKDNNNYSLIYKL